MLFQSRGGILMGGIPIESGHPELPQHSPADSLKAEVTFQEAASRVVRRRTGTRLGRWGLPTVLFLITSAFVVACGGGNTNVKAAVAPTTAPATATQEIPSSPTAEATPTIQPRPTEQATSTATPDNKPKLPEMTHEQAMAGIQSVIDQIQNPDPALIAKYKITPDVLKREQDIIIRGFSVQKEAEKTMPPTPDSLLGVKEAISNNNYTLAMERILQIYPRIQNSMTTGPNGDDISNRMNEDQVRQLDPDKRFLFYPPAGSPLYSGSAVKKDAAFRAMKLYYDLRYVVK